MEEETPEVVSKPPQVAAVATPSSPTLASSQATAIPSSTEPSPQKPEEGGLKLSDAWKDAPAKKIHRSDSQKKEKRQKSLSLKTRKHTPSFKEKYKGPTGLPPAEIEGILERKQELQSGGKKATIRSWKHFYTVLCGQLLCFFKDKQGIATYKPLCFFKRRIELDT